MKNKYEIRGDVTVIFLNYKGTTTTTTISTSDLQRVSMISGSWYAMNVGTADNEKVYVGTKIGGVTVYLHSIIMNNPPKTVVDHTNHNTLDNTRNNLAAVSYVVNGQNRKGAQRNNKSSGLRNVYRNGSGNWYVQLHVNGKAIHFGTYKTKEEANSVAERARRAYYHGNDYENIQEGMTSKGYKSRWGVLQ
ncbi:hypothetical protein [Halobacillus ihumii]|uniref:hypothetical protein n=1 Tax=Halobacillus ihumii TaxID=2686092 RepID=UPI0013D5AD51|nr:hypothetical protein [Halobacillus ihumii]